ncbi:hypothetical protein PAHAL_7G297200 [Panicum hallii]|uniref:Uncharacterized protein n=1 Tax=Panicum hallii TaxID=206008 RepID=A0A2T8IDY7_9POAL|nr:hypothetical protein PAHAL_7G297200 [Panicum hallii]
MKPKGWVRANITSSRRLCTRQSSSYHRMSIILFLFLLFSSLLVCVRATYS